MTNADMIEDSPFENEWLVGSGDDAPAAPRMAGTGRAGSGSAQRQANAIERNGGPLRVTRPRSIVLVGLIRGVASYGPAGASGGAGDVASAKAASDRSARRG
jgi:hypothetical protein